MDSLGRAGHPFTVTYTLIPAAPTVLTPPTSPASTRTPSWQITNSDVDFDHYTCTSTVPVLSCTSTVQLDLTGLVDGTYTVTVRAVDSLGRAGDPTTLAFSLIPPAPYVTAPAASAASGRAPKWTIADDVVDFAATTARARSPYALRERRAAGPGRAR